MKKSRFIIGAVETAAFAAALVAHAQTSELPMPPQGSGQTFSTFANGIVSIVDKGVIPLLYAAAFLVFLWGAANYFFFKGGEDKGREEARGFILWGIIGLVVIFGVWGIVHLLLTTFLIAS